VQTKTKLTENNKIASVNYTNKLHKPQRIFRRMHSDYNQKTVTIK